MIVFCLILSSENTHGQVLSEANALLIVNKNGYYFYNIFLTDSFSKISPLFTCLFVCVREEGVNASVVAEEMASYWSRTSSNTAHALPMNKSQSSPYLEDGELSTMPSKCSMESMFEAIT